MYIRRCHVSGSSICGNIDVKNGKCDFCSAGRKIKDPPMMLYDCSIGGSRDVEAGECEACPVDNVIKQKEIYRSARNEGIWLGIGIGLFSAGTLVWIMEYFLG